MSAILSTLYQEVGPHRLSAFGVMAFVQRPVPDGREIYYNRGDRLYSIAVKAEAAVTAGNPTALPITGFIQEAGRRQFDISSDGKQFLMLFLPR